MVRTPLVALAALALGACSLSVSTEKLFSGTVSPHAVLADGSFVYCEPGANEMRVLPASDRTKPVTLLAVESCAKPPHVFSRRNAVVLQRIAAEGEPPSPAVAWSPTSGTFTLRDSVQLGSRHIAGSWDSRWLFVTEHLDAESGYDVLAEYDLSKSPPVRQEIGQFDAKCTRVRVLATAEPATRVLLRTCAGQDAAGVVSVDWTTQATSLVFVDGKRQSVFFSVSADGRWVFTEDVNGALVRVPIDGGNATTVAEGALSLTTSADGTRALVLDGHQDLYLWSEKDASRKVASDVRSLGRASPDFGWALVAKGEYEPPDGAESPYEIAPTDVLLLNLATGKTEPLTAGRKGSLDDAWFSPDSASVAWLDEVTPLGDGTLRLRAVEQGEAHTIGTNVGNAAFTEAGTLLVDGNHTGTTLWGDDSRYTISAWAAPDDGDPLVVASGAVAGKFHVAGEHVLHYVLADGKPEDGLYRAELSE